MEENQIQTFATELGKLAMATGWNLSEGEIEVYWDDLREFDLQDVIGVMRRWRRECEWFPKLSQIMDGCRRVRWERQEAARPREIREERLLAADNERTRPATREEVRELLLEAGLRLRPMPGDYESEPDLDARRAELEKQIEQIKDTVN